MIDQNFLLFSSNKYPNDRPNILRRRDPRDDSDRGQDVLHRVRLVPARRRGQAKLNLHRILVKVQFIVNQD